MIRDARIEGLNFIQIAEKLKLSKQFVFDAHMKLMQKKLLGWKAEYIESPLEIPSPNQTDEKTNQPVTTITSRKDLVITWFIPMTPTKKSRVRFSFNFRKNGQTNGEARNGKKKSK